MSMLTYSAFPWRWSLICFHHWELNICRICSHRGLKVKKRSRKQHFKLCYLYDCINIYSTKDLVLTDPHVPVEWCLPHGCWLLCCGLHCLVPGDSESSNSHMWFSLCAYLHVHMHDVETIHTVFYLIIFLFYIYIYFLIA